MVIGQIGDDTLNEEAIRAIRDRLREVRGGSNTPSMSAIADVIDAAVQLDLIEARLCDVCGVGVVGCAMAGPFLDEPGRTIHEDCVTVD